MKKMQRRIECTSQAFGIMDGYGEAKETKTKNIQDDDTTDFSIQVGMLGNVKAR